MKSCNFEILRPRWPELASLGGFAEAYAHDDPASALVKLRLFAENLTKDIYRDLGLPIMKDTGCSIGPISGGCFTATLQRRQRAAAREGVSMPR